MQFSRLLANRYKYVKAKAKIVGFADSKLTQVAPRTLMYNAPLGQIFDHRMSALAPQLP